MRGPLIAGYLLTALLYANALWSPHTGVGESLVAWTTFTKLCLTEFLTMHAATLLGALVLADAIDPGAASFGSIFWALLAGYAALALGAYLMHRSHRALIGF